MKLNKLLLTTSLVPIAVVPAMVSCNKNTKIDDLHLMVLYNDLSYLPKGSFDAKTRKLLPIKYSKGIHTFVLEEIDSSSPVYEFGLEIDSREWTISKTNFKVMLDENKDITNQWRPTTLDTFTIIGEESAAISKGKIAFTIEILQDVENAYPCFNID